MKRIPCLAPSPFPTIMATGVASPNAQGQEITRTEMACSKARTAVAPRNSQTAATRTDKTITAGTKNEETTSAIRATGAFEAAASLTICRICENVVSSPTRRALAFINPNRLIVAAATVSPSFLSDGTDSPVRADSSTVVTPSRITPSAGMISPGRTRKTSPFFTSRASIVMISLPRSTVACFGARRARLFKASVVRLRERDSKSFPTVIRAGIIAADSK